KKRLTVSILRQILCYSVARIAMHPGKIYPARFRGLSVYLPPPFARLTPETSPEPIGWCR
ncbi:TPA: hypothetical protein ACIUKE_004460, partial [Salmonella enterica subsp. enterica serovar Aberdeen]